MSEIHKDLEKGWKFKQVRLFEISWKYFQTKYWINIAVSLLNDFPFKFQFNHRFLSRVGKLV